MTPAVATSRQVDGRAEIGATPRIDPRLRVMQIVHSLDPGGTERLVIEIVNRLAASVDSIVCCLDGPGSWATELTARGTPVIALQRSAGFRPTLGGAIARLAADRGIDILHCHHYSPFVYGQIAAFAHRRLRVVFTEHGRLSDARPSPKRRLINPLLGRLPAAVFAVSSDLRRYMTLEGFAGSRVQVMHNGIEPGRRPTPVDRALARRMLDLPHDAVVVGAAGRLDPVKDWPSLLRGFAELRRLHADARLVIIGDGPERTRLADEVRALGVATDVAIVGYRSDVRQLLPAFDVFVNSSIHEGVSLTILEAMAAALPVVATSVGGTPEVVVDGETGLLVAPRSPQAIGAALATLARDAERGRRLGEAGRFRVKRHFNIDAMVSGYLDAYRRCAKR